MQAWSLHMIQKNITQRRRGRKGRRLISSLRVLHYFFSDFLTEINMKNTLN